VSLMADCTRSAYPPAKALQDTELPRQAILYAFLLARLHDSVLFYPSLKVSEERILPRLQHELWTLLFAGTHTISRGLAFVCGSTESGDTRFDDSTAYAQFRSSESPLSTKSPAGSTRALVVDSWVHIFSGGDPQFAAHLCSPVSPGTGFLHDLRTHLSDQLFVDTEPQDFVFTELAAEVSLSTVRQVMRSCVSRRR